MNMTRVILTLIFISGISIVNGQFVTTIKGVVKGVGNSKVYIGNKTSGVTNSFTPIVFDSIDAKNDSFEFKNFKFKEIDFYSIQHSGHAGWLPFIIDTGIITIYAEKDSLYKGKVSGSMQHDIYKSFQKNFEIPYYYSTQPYYDSLDKYVTKDTLKYSYFREILEPMMQKMVNDEKQFIKQNRNSYYSLHLLSVLERALKDSLGYYFNLLSQKLRNHTKAIDIRYKITSFSKNVSPGALIPNFEFKKVTGEKLTLYDVPSQKYKLIIFWASWCAPCIAELPYLKIIDTMFNNINLISFSLDNKKEQWISSSIKNNITWTSVSDLKGISGKFARYFSVHEIPLLILLDARNRVVKYNISLKEVMSILRSD